MKNFTGRILNGKLTIEFATGKQEHSDKSLTCHNNSIKSIKTPILVNHFIKLDIHRMGWQNVNTQQGLSD
jgi:hypothetical protein